MRLNFMTSASLLLLTAVSLSAAPTIAPRDVPGNHWAKRSVDSVTAKGIMKSQGSKFNGNAPVTRYELAVALDRLVGYIEAGRKPLHPTKRPKISRIPSDATPDERKAIIHLVSEGFLPANSPLVTGNGHKIVTAKELRAAMAQVTIAISDRAEPPQSN